MKAKCATLQLKNSVGAMCAPHTHPSILAPTHWKLSPFHWQFSQITIPVAATLYALNVWLLNTKVNCCQSPVAIMPRYSCFWYSCIFAYWFCHLLSLARKFTLDRSCSRSSGAALADAMKVYDNATQQPHPRPRPFDDAHLSWGGVSTPGSTQTKGTALNVQFWLAFYGNIQK